jgi:ketosteroid isomerase-like protein
MDHADVETWVSDYERLWRQPGADLLERLFTPDATYLPSPWSQPVVGLPAIARLWEGERSGPDEHFTMSSSVVAVDHRTAVVRVEVEYGRADGSRWRNLWVVELAEDARCSSFAEWPFAPGRADEHSRANWPTARDIAGRPEPLTS